jgi:hypothetical protein
MARDHPQTRGTQAARRVGQQELSPREEGMENMGQPVQTEPSPNTNIAVSALGSADKCTDDRMIDTSPAAVLPLPLNLEGGALVQCSHRACSVVRQLSPSIDMNRTMENSMAPEGVQSGEFRSIDLNQMNPQNRSLSAGTGGTYFPPNQAAGTLGSEGVMVFTSNPSTPRSSDSVIPVHLMEEYREWLKERHGMIVQARVQSPQATRLANQAILRRNFMEDASRQQRSRRMVDNRLLRRSISAEAPRLSQTHPIQ